MGFRDNLRRYKFIHWIYNLFHYRALLHNQEAYRRYHIDKPLFSSISSRDFPDKESKAWLDLGDSQQLVSAKEAFHKFSLPIQEQLLSWSENGFMIIPNHFSSKDVDSIKDEIEILIRRKKLRQ